MNLTTSFKTLGIGPEADEVQAKRAYKDQVRRWHPDQFPEGSTAKTGAEEQLKQINIAYAFVKTHLANHPSAPAVPAGATPPRPNQAGIDRHDMAGEKAKKRSWVDHLFDALKVCAGNRAGGPSAPPDAETDTDRRKTFEQVLSEMAGGGIHSKLKCRPGSHPAAGRRAAASYRHAGRKGAAVGSVGGAERPGPVKPVSRVRGIGRNR
ncbi:J domain-containing protein [Desulfosarcina sp.]|uniref:J domain-containing protein n=1 Tax=Desulfosarcina sp. TaxID=2027861 RepID=UPI003566C19A